MDEITRLQSENENLRATIKSCEQQISDIGKQMRVAKKQEVTNNAKLVQLLAARAVGGQASRQPKAS